MIEKVEEKEGPFADDLFLELQVDSMVYLEAFDSNFCPEQGLRII